MAINSLSCHNERYLSKLFETNKTINFKMEGKNYEDFLSSLLPVFILASLKTKILICVKSKEKTAVR